MQYYLRSLRLPLLTLIQLHLPPCLLLRCPHLVFLPFSISSLSDFYHFSFSTLFYNHSGKTPTSITHKRRKKKTNFFSFSFLVIYIFLWEEIGEVGGWKDYYIATHDVPRMSCYMKSVHAWWVTLMHMLASVEQGTWGFSCLWHGFSYPVFLWKRWYVYQK